MCGACDAGHKSARPSKSTGSGSTFPHTWYGWRRAVLVESRAWLGVGGLGLYPRDWPRARSGESRRPRKAAPFASLGKAQSQARPACQSAGQKKTADRAAEEEGGCQTSQAADRRRSIAAGAPRAAQTQPRNVHARTSRAACNVGSARFPNPPLGGDYQRSAPGARQSGGPC